MRHKRKFLQAQPEHSSKVMTLLVAFLFCLYAFSTLYPLLERIVGENLYFGGLPTNGAFQMLNLLKRMDIGQIPGKDFYFFHGIGTLLLHRPLYLLLGQNLWASNTSIYIVGLLCFTSSLYFFVRGVGLGKYDVWLLLPVLTSFFYKITPQLIYFKLNTPGARSFFPILAIGVLLSLRKRLFSGEKGMFQFLFSVLAGVFSAISFFISVEHGLALSVATAITLLLCNPFRSSFLKKILSLVIFIGTLSIVTIFLFSLVSGSCWYKPLVMALVTIPKQQFWFFGAPPHTIIKNYWFFLLNPPTVYVYFIYIGLLLLLIWGVLFWHQRQAANDRFFCALMFLFVIYGLLTTASILGYFSKIYFLPLVRVLLLSIFALLIWWEGKINIVRRLLPSAVTQQYKKMTIACVLLVLAFFLINAQLLPIYNKKIPSQNFVLESWSAGWRLLVMAAIPLLGMYVKQLCLTSAPIQRIKYKMYFSSLITLAAVTVFAQFVSIPLHNLMTRQRLTSFQSNQLVLSNRWYQNISAVEALLGPFTHLEYKEDTEEWGYFVRHRENTALIPPPAKQSIILENFYNKEISLNLHFFITNEQLPDKIKVFSWLCLNDQYYGWVKGIEKIGDHTRIELDYLRNEPPMSSSAATITLPHALMDQGDLWFTYANVIQHGYNIVNPSTDYIIHLLDQELNDDYLHTFVNNKPKWVGTIRGHTWTPWLQYTHFDFYGFLYRFYMPRLLTPDYVIWEKQIDDDWQLPDDEEWRNIPWPDKGFINLKYVGNGQKQLIVVRIDYQTKNRFSLLPIAGKTPRYWLRVEQDSPIDIPLRHRKKQMNKLRRRVPISLPPMPLEGRIDVPILLPSDSDIIAFVPETVSPFGFSVELNIKNIQYREMRIPPETMFVLNEFQVKYKPAF